MSPLIFGAASFSQWVLLGLLGCGAVVGVWILVQARKSRQPGDGRDDAAKFGVAPDRGGSKFADRTKVTLGLDGFWLEISDVSSGSWIVYHYLCAGKWHVGRVRYRPGATGQFVYTGGRPERAEVIEVQAEDTDSSADFEVGSSRSLDTTNFAAPAAAWYATTESNVEAPAPRHDPPAY